MKTRLVATLKQWKEIYNNEMTYSADLRNQEKASKAHSMILKLESMIAGLA